MKMRAKILSALITALIAAFLAVGAQAQSRLDLKTRPIKNALLVKILNDGLMEELKPPSPAASPYFLRLYSIGELGDCAPEVETEVTCSHRYYLAVTDGSLGVPGAIYELGEVGEISKIEWLETSDLNIARLRLEISNYPKAIFEYNPKLVRKTKIVEIDVNTTSLKIKAIK